MKQLFLSCAAALVLSSCGACSLGPEAEGGGFVLLSYNVHNLFDDRDDGTEYPEYDPGGGKWTSADYARRLAAVGRAVRESAPGGPDFAAFMEIENLRVLEDLRGGPLRDLEFPYILCPPADGAPVRVGVLSRIPVADAWCHLPAGAGYPQRPVLEVLLDAGGARLSVFVCHFKSKTEGAEKTEESRVLAASAVRRRIAELLREDPAADILVLGDLNENADEYERTGGRYPTALMPEAAAHPPEGFAVTGSRPPDPPDDGKIVLYSPWLDDPPRPGSYLYGGRWETIDHALLSRGLFDGKGLVYSRFAAGGPDFLTAADGSPDPAFSDHLPVMVTLRRAEAP